MTINAVPERSDIIVGDGDVWTCEATWLEFFQSIFAALFGWKRSYTAVKNHDFGNMAAGGEDTTTVEVRGARQGDHVTVSAKTRVAGLGVDGFVTANNEVTIRRFNFSTGAINPGADDFRVIVLQQ